ncbi:MAG: response regulator transcription factor [Firmicutes bacterium]|nr:response regulator transcription factor [Bacillota bacterium]MBQ6810064.1 response regulator transcription factor [Bacillota bacterium]
MYIAICDDQEFELNTLKDLIEKWQTYHHTTLPCKWFHSAAEMLDAAETETFTLYLLDVMMPGTNGIDAAKEIRTFDQTAEIVFLTSSPGFAYESYGVHALDYLLKPIRAELLFPILDKLFLKEQKPEEGLTLRSGATLIRILFSQLTYVEVIGKHLYFHLTDGTSHEVYAPLKDYAPLLLTRTEFVQTHRSYIVNMFQIAELSPKGIQTFAGENLPISRLLYSKVQKEYMKLLFEKEDE